MIIDKHPEAITVTLLIVAERMQRACPGLDEAAHEVLARYFEDWPDEKKADLYALLAERLKDNMTMGRMQQVVSNCLHDNDINWAKRHG